MMLRTFSFLLLAALGVGFTAGPAAASEIAPGGYTPPLASYWEGFIEHWSGVFQRQNGIVMGVVLVGALCLFIITRGKWRK